MRLLIDDIAVTMRALYTEDAVLAVRDTQEE